MMMVLPGRIALIGGRQVVGERHQSCAIDLRAPRDNVIVPGDAVLETGDAF